MGEQEKVQLDQPLRLIFDDRALHIDFVNLFQANGTPEFLVVTAVQRFPEADEPIPDNVPLEQLPPSGRVLARFAITWPHAVRLRDLLDRLIEQYKDQVVSAISILGGEQDESAGESTNDG